MKLNQQQIIYMLGLIILGILSRVIFKLAPNFELVTAISVIAAFFIRSRFSYLVPLAVIIISDLIIKNSNIILFTWSGFLLAHLVAKLFANYSFGISNRFILVNISGITAVVIFFLWTNLGVVLLTNIYSHDFAGLIQSYINALPFLRPELISTMIFVPIFYLISIRLLLNKSYSQLDLSRAL